LTTPLTAKLTRPLTGAELEELFLEKFKFTLGSELVTNGDFSNGTTGWSAGGGATLSIDNSRLKITNNATGNSYANQTLSTVAGKQYKVSVDYIDDTGGNALIWAGTSFGGNQLGTQTFIATGTYTLTFTATGTTSYLRIGANEPTSGTIYFFDNVSVKEITKQAPVAAFSLRKLGDVSPYAARIRRSSDNTEAQVMFDASNRVSESSGVRNTSQNLLSYSEDFSNGAWTKVNTTVSFANITDPFGGTNAYIAKPNTANSQHRLDLPTSVGTGPHTFSVFAKAEAYNAIWMRRGGSSTTFDLTNGTVLADSGNNNPTITAVGTDGWYRLSITKTGSANDTFRINVTTTAISGGDYTGNGTDGVYLFGAMLEETVTYESTPSIPYSEDFNDDTGGWTKNESGGSNTTLSHETTNPLSGSGSLKIALSNTGTSGGYPRVRKNTGTAFRTGIKYRLSFKAKALSGTCECDIRFGTASTNMYLVTNQAFTTTEQTYTYTDTFDTLPTAGTDAIQFIFDGTKGPFELLIDDVKVEEFDPIPSEYISTPVVSNDGLTFTETTLDDFVGGENLHAHSTGVNSTTYQNLFLDTLTANVSTAPDNSTTAARARASSGTSRHELHVKFAGVSGTIYTHSMYVKPLGSITHITMSAGGAENSKANFDIINGTAGEIGGNNLGHSITSEGDGWFRISITYQAVTTSSTSKVYFSMGEAASSASVYSNVTGDGTKGFLYWGAQTNTGSTIKKHQPTTGTARDGNASIVTLYNQTGGEDAIQSNTSHQPLLYKAGLLVKSGSSPAWEHDTASNMELFGQIKAAHLDAWFVAEPDSADTHYLYPANYATTGDHGFVAQDGSTSVSLSADYGGFNVKLYVNGTLLGSSGSITRDEVHTALNGKKLVHHQDADTADWAQSQMGFYGSFNNNTFNFQGKFSEWIFFDSDQSANREAIEKHINDFHNIF